MKTSNFLASSSLTLLGCSCLMASPATAQILNLDPVSADITTEETNFEFNTLDIPIAGEFDPASLFRFDWDIHAQNNFDYPVLIKLVSFDLFELDEGNNEDGTNDFLGNFVFGPPPQDIILEPGGVASPPCFFPATCSRRFNVAGSQLNPGIDDLEGNQLEFTISNVQVTAHRVPEPGTTAATILAFASAGLFRKRLKDAK